MHRAGFALTPTMIAATCFGVSLLTVACGGLEEEQSRPAPATRASSLSATVGSGPIIRLPRSTTPTSPEPPDTTSSPPEIVSFDVDAPLPCTDAASATTAEVRYVTARADRVVFVVDDRQLEIIPPPAGSLRVELPCDARTHYVLMIAADPWDRTATETRHLAGGLRQQEP